MSLSLINSANPSLAKGGGGTTKVCVCVCVCGGGGRGFAKVDLLGRSCSFSCLLGRFGKLVVRLIQIATAHQPSHSIFCCKTRLCK